MSRRVILCAIAAAWIPTGLLPAAEPRDNESSRDLKQLQGTWLQVSVFSKGEQGSGGEMLIVQDATMTFMKDDTETIKFDIKVDAVPDPKQIDLSSFSSQEEKAKQAEARRQRKLGEDVPDLTPPTMLGVYGIGGNGDQFVMAFSPAGKERPTKLSSGKDDGVMMMVFKRAKNGVAGDLKRMQGTWRQTHVFVEAEARQPKHTLVVKDDVMSLLEGDQEAATFDVKLNSTSDPKTIDLISHLTEEQNKLIEAGKELHKIDKTIPVFTPPTLPGIYYIGKLKDDNDGSEKLILVYRLPGKDRPTKFGSAQGDEATLMLFERVEEK